MTRLNLFGVLVIVFSFVSVPLIAQEVDNRIEELLTQLESDKFAIRHEAQNELLNLGQEAVKPLWETCINPDSSLDRKTASKAIFDRWIELESDSALASLFDLISQTDLRGDSSEIVAARRFLLQPKTVSTIRRILGKNRRLKFSSGRASIQNWTYSRQESRLISLLPDIGNLNVQAVVPVEFFHDQKDSSIEHMTVHATMGDSQEMSGTVMDAILAIENLHTLDLRDGRLAPEAVQRLAETDKITNLTYKVTRQEDFALIAQMSKLVSFTFMGEFKGDRIVVDADSFRPMTKLDLNYLSFGPCKLESGVCEIIGEFPNLTSVHLYYPELDTVRALMGHQQITNVKMLAHPTNVDLCAAVLSEAEHLATLDLGMSSVTDVGLESLAKMDFLTMLSFSSGMISKQGKRKIQSALGEILQTPFMLDDTISEDDSRMVHEMAQKGLYAHSFPRQPQFFVFQENWTGTDEDFVRIIEMRGWKCLITDLPLTPPIADALVANLKGERPCVIFDSGQHPEGAVDRMRAEFSIRPFGDPQRRIMPESGEGEAFVLK